MNAALISLAVALAVFAAGLIGLFGYRLLPPTHQSRETQETVRLGIGMLSVLASLVLGLLIASAKGSWDATDHAVRGYAAELILLDETLRDYGEAAATPRRLLLDYTRQLQQDLWPAAGQAPTLDDSAAGRRLELVRETIRALRPIDKPGEWLQDQALQTHISLVRQRWQLIEQQGPAVSPVVLGILVSWIVVIFASFGLNAPRNATVLVAFLVCALAIGGSVFLILEMDTPFTGVLAIPPDPVARAIGHMAAPSL